MDNINLVLLHSCSCSWHSTHIQQKIIDQYIFNSIYILSSVVTFSPKHYIYGHLVMHIGGLAQERRNSIANALELCLSCTKPSIYITDLGHHWFNLSPFHHYVTTWTYNDLIIGSIQITLVEFLSKFSDCLHRKATFGNIICKITSIFNHQCVLCWKYHP